MKSTVPPRFPAETREKLSCGTTQSSKSLGFSTVFSTGVENYSGRPFRDAFRGREHVHRRNPATHPQGHDSLTYPERLGYDHKFLSFVHDTGTDNEANLSAEPSSSSSDARIPGPYGDEERPARPQAPPRQGTQAPDRLVATAAGAPASADRRGDRGRAFQTRATHPPPIGVPARLRARAQDARSPAHRVRPAHRPRRQPAWDLRYPEVWECRAEEPRETPDSGGLPPAPLPAGL